MAAPIISKQLGSWLLAGRRLRPDSQADVLVWPRRKYPPAQTDWRQGRQEPLDDDLSMQGTDRVEESCRA